MSAPPSEATRPAPSTLDERIVRERERIRAQVRFSRQRQGLPTHVQDISVLDRLAGRLLERVAEPAELPWAGEDEPTVTRRGQEREARQHAP